MLALPVSPSASTSPTTRSGSPYRTTPARRPPHWPRQPGSAVPQQRRSSHAGTRKAPLPGLPGAGQRSPDAWAISTPGADDTRNASAVARATDPAAPLPTAVTTYAAPAGLNPTNTEPTVQPSGLVTRSTSDTVMAHAPGSCARGRTTVTSLEAAGRSKGAIPGRAARLCRV